MKNNMKKISTAVCACLEMLLLMCMSVVAAESDLDRYVTGLEKRYAAMQDFRADFEQQTRLASVNYIEKGHGTVAFKKGGKMLWHYKAPEEQKVILDGKNLWFYVPKEKQVMKNNFSTIPQHIVVDIFRGQINIRERFTVTLLPPDGTDAAQIAALELIPREYDPTVKKLILWMDTQKNIITRTQLEDDLGTRTVLSFIKIEIDKGIKDSLFEFTPPKGVEVFEPPKVQ